MRRCRLVAAVLLAAQALPAAGEAKEYFVSPGGRADGDGTRARPWDLATALAGTGRIRPGETVWLLGGTYRGRFTSRLKGTRRQPVLVRQAPHARAVIDCRAAAGGDAPFSVEGEWTTFWGFEVTCSDRRRVTTIAGSHPDDIRRGGINCRGSNIRFINLVVHDCGCGFGFWSGGQGGEIYGCLIYNNGWRGPDRGHGHGIYAQNKTGTKRLVDNIIFNQFSYGIHAYGSARAFLKGFHVEGNACFNNGSPCRTPTPDLLIGGGCPAERVRVIDNFTYHADRRARSVQLGYGPANADAVVEGNFFVGEVSLRKWARLRLTGNTFLGLGRLVTLEAAKDAPLAGCQWDENTYYGPPAKAAPKPFALSAPGGGGQLDFAAWRARTGFDKSGTYRAGTPEGVEVFIRPNRHELGRAHIIVYNWPRQDAVELDLKPFLKVGGRYDVVSAEAYFGRPVAAGTFDGKPVRIPLWAVPPAAPVGLPEAELPPAGPEFSAFVLRPRP